MNRFLIFCIAFLLILPIVTAQENQQSFKQFLISAEEEIKQGLDGLKSIRKQLDNAAEEIQQAQREMEDSNGFLSPLLAQERQRKARQTHHELSMKLKTQQRLVMRMARRTAQRILAEKVSLQRQIDLLDAEIESAKPRQVDTLQSQKLELTRVMEKNQQLVEKRLGRYAKTIREEMQQDPDEEGFPVPPPPRGHNPNRMDSLPGDPSPPNYDPWKRPGFVMRQFGQEYESMKQRIDQLEQEVEMLKQKVKKLEQERK